MRLLIDHRTRYRFSTPQARVIQMLRMTPSDHDAQTVTSWRIDLGCDARLKHGHDGYGNVIGMLYVDGPVEMIDIAVHGEVLTEDRDGLVTGAREPLPVELFKRTTALTRPGDRLPNFARDVANGRDILDRLNRLNRAVHERIKRTHGQPDMTRSATESFEEDRGVTRDLAHVLIAAARALDIPARFVSGYWLTGAPNRTACTAHSWAEAHVDGLGWVGFDPCTGLCPDERYVRVAAGLDAGYATPVSGARSGGGEEDLDVDVRVDVARPED